MVCTGIIKKKTAIPARHDGPIAYNNNIITDAACRGPIHRKCKYNVTCKKSISSNIAKVKSVRSFIIQVKRKTLTQRHKRHRPTKAITL